MDIYTAYSLQRLKRVRNSHSTFITGKRCGGGQCCGSGSGPFCWIRTFLLNPNPDFYQQMWVPIELVILDPSPVLVEKIRFQQFVKKNQFIFKIKSKHYLTQQVFEWVYIWIRTRVKNRSDLQH